MRILICTSGAMSKLSGVNVMLKELCTGLSKRGHSVIFLGQIEQMSEFWKGIFSKNIDFRGFRFSFVKILSTINYFKPDIISTHDRNVDIKMSIISRISKIPHIVTLHGKVSSLKFKLYTYIPPFNSLRNLLWRKALNNCEKIIAISEDVKTDAIETFKIPNSKIVKIYNAVNTEKFKPLFTDPREAKKTFMPQIAEKLVLLCAGRLAKEKKAHKLIDLIKIINLKGIDCIGMYSGIGPMEKELKEYAEEKCMKSKVIFLGLRQDMEKIYNCCDFLVHFGENEGFGLVIAEAMSCGRPIIGINKGVLKELVEPDINGYLVEPDNLELMAEKIINIYKDKKKYEQLSHNNREKAISKFRVERFISEYEKVAFEILDKNK